MRSPRTAWLDRMLTRTELKAIDAGAYLELLEQARCWSPEADR